MELPDSIVSTIAMQHHDDTRCLKALENSDYAVTYCSFFKATNDLATRRCNISRSVYGLEKPTGSDMKTFGTSSVCKFETLTQAIKSELRAKSNTSLMEFGVRWIGVAVTGRENYTIWNGNFLPGFRQAIWWTIQSIWRQQILLRSIRRKSEYHRTQSGSLISKLLELQNRLIPDRPFHRRDGTILEDYWSSYWKGSNYSFGRCFSSGYHAVAMITDLIITGLKVQ